MKQEDLERGPRCTPFSCGSESVDWYMTNCDLCARAHRDERGQMPEFEDGFKLVENGLHCAYELHIQWGFINGECNLQAIEEIGGNGGMLTGQCPKFKTGYDFGPPDPDPIPVAPHQLVLPLAPIIDPKPIHHG